MSEAPPILWTPSPARVERSHMAAFMRAHACADYDALWRWSVEDLGYATMIRRPGYGDHLEATVDPDIRARQRSGGAPPGFEDAIAFVVMVLVLLVRPQGLFGRAHLRME